MTFQQPSGVFPPDIWLEILQWCPTTSLKNLCLTSKTLHSLASEQLIQTLVLGQNILGTYSLSPSLNNATLVKDPAAFCRAVLENKHLRWFRAVKTVFVVWGKRLILFIINVLLGKIADLIGQLNERDLEIANFTTTIKDLDDSRHASTCQWHRPPRERVPDSEDRERVTLPEEMQDSPRYEESVNPLLPPHSSETWGRDDAYDNREPWKWADPSVVLARKQFNATLANDPLASGVFLGDKPYTKELDDKLHEAMETSAARWKVEKKAMRYMVWNDEIEDREAKWEGEAVPNWNVGEVVSEIHDKARKAGLFEPEYSGKM
ncbi:hypothetical protein KCU67_g9344, partial [Aureobasidium melanogenum]